MHKVLVLTDLHIRSAGETIIGLDPLTRLRCAPEHALARHAAAAAMVLMGGPRFGMPFPPRLMRMALCRRSPISARTG